MAVTQSEVLNLFDLIGAVTNNDFVLMQVSSGAAKKVNTQILAAYLGQLAIGFLATATDAQVTALFNLLEPPTSAQGSGSTVTLGGLYKFLVGVRTMVQTQVDGLASASDVNTALAAIRNQINQLEVTPHRFLTEAAYAELVANGEVDPDVTYLTYEG